MKTIVIPQFYRGPSGQRGLYNRQEVGLARAFAALGCRAVVLYPEPGAKAPRIETPEPNVKICYMPAAAFGVQAFYKSWQILLDEQADAFCRALYEYQRQLGAALQQFVTETEADMRVVGDDPSATVAHLGLFISAPVKTGSETVDKLQTKRLD